MPLTVSAVVPVYNEEGAAVQVAREIETAFTAAFGADGFERVLDLLEDGCSALLAESRSEK